MRAISQRRWFLIALLSGVLFLSAGCKKEQGENLLPVSGKIAVAGKPITTGNVTFYPDESKGNKSPHQPMGVLDSEGNYEVFVPGGKKGAPPGWYKVVVYAVDDPQPGKPNKFLVDKDYADVSTTPWKVEVIDDPAPGRYDLELKR